MENNKSYVAVSNLFKIDNSSKETLDLVYNASENVDISYSLNHTLTERTDSNIIIVCTAIFVFVGIVGIGGNLLVILSVMCNKKMRKSVTNLLITNLAFADLIIMVFGIPEIVEFMKNSGWTLNLMTCKINRYILVSALYGSILTLGALSVERYIAIIHPIKAHILCNKRRLVVVLGCIWPFSWLAGLPTLFFNTIQQGHPNVSVRYCMLQFPEDHDRAFLIFKYIESILFYFLPLALQISLYCVVSRHLFIGTDRLYRRVNVRDVQLNAPSLERFSEALQARRGVVKMLIMSVFVYFVSYGPNQVLLVWNTFSPTTFHDNWAFLVFTMIISYANSAANPIMYSIFSQNFRQCFRQLVCNRLLHNNSFKLPPQPPSYMRGSPKLSRRVSMATASTHV